MHTKILSISLFLLVFFVKPADAQSTWFPVAGNSNPIHYVENLDGHLFGHLALDSVWIIKEYNGTFWQGVKPIPLNQDLPQDLAYYQGKLHALTSEKCYRLDGLVWTEVFSGYGFEKIIQYNNILIIHGAFTTINGILTAGNAYFDGTTFGVLKDALGNNASITGDVRDMVVYNNYLYMSGNIFNTHLGTIYSNVVKWDGSTFTEGFITPFQNPKPEVNGLLINNGDLYFNMSLMDKTFGVFKLNGNGLTPLDSIDASLHSRLNSNATKSNNLVFFNNELHSVLKICDSIPQWGFCLLSDILMRYNGTYWEPTLDTLRPYFWGDQHHNTLYPNAEALKRQITVHNNSLFAFCASPFDRSSLVSRLDSGSMYTLNPKIADLRKTTCHIDSTERLLEGLVKIDHLNYSFYYHLNNKGTNFLSIPSSNPTQFTLEDKALPAYTPNACSDSTLTVSSSSQNSLVFFQNPKTPIVDISTSLSSNLGSICRPGFDQKYYIDAHNFGTEPVYNLTIEFTYPQKTNYLSSSVTPTSNINHTLIFNVDTLEPYEKTRIHILLFNSLNHVLGDSAAFQSFSTLNTGLDAVPQNDTSILTQIAVASYDPNSKHVNYETVSQWGGTLDYQINFQNLGTDTAFNVIVIDSLPQHILPGTFRLISSSDPVEVSLIDHLLMFSFQNIGLPDSSSYPEESKGFVRFNIDMKTNLSNSDTIKNRGHIYFDFQPAVVTNYAKTFKSIGIGIKEDSKTGLKLYPNPNKGVFYVQAPDKLSLDLINVTGQQVVKLNFESGVNQIDLQHLPAGLYFLVGDDYVEKIQIVR